MLLVCSKRLRLFSFFILLISTHSAIGQGIFFYGPYCIRRGANMALSTSFNFSLIWRTFHMLLNSDSNIYSHKLVMQVSNCLLSLLQLICPVKSSNFQALFPYFVFQDIPVVSLLISDSKYNFFFTIFLKTFFLLIRPIHEIDDIITQTQISVALTLLFIRDETLNRSLV